MDIYFNSVDTVEYLSCGKCHFTNKYYCNSDLILFENQRGNVGFDSLSLLSVFSRRCKCESNWKLNFCENFLKHKKNQFDKSKLPNICICRQIYDGENCQQFITQCYATKIHSKDKCFCCFNQPWPYCNQIQCNNGQPDFGSSSNVTCICHQPALYPYYLCKDEMNSNYDSAYQPHLNLAHTETVVSKQKKKAISFEKALSILNVELTPFVACVFLLSLLSIVIIITVLLIIIRSYRFHRITQRRRRLRREAQSTLLNRRRDDDDRYLP
ncbi:unnamed protein product [Dracunculus medinensis]|uniref:EGF-like domain-containing protein n=1 Tax=Dracunculus medinensis TaxID=318479 RepID=A0A0N4UPM0_DRAME|nr:unnamed protein product [Dracunculus medinensis]